MKIGITGASGFIGMHLYESLNNKFECEVFDKSKYDLFNINSMESFVKNKDIIFHLAGANRASNDDLLKINTQGTINLLEAIRKFSNEKTKFVLSSSMQVYGLSSQLKYFNEQDLPRPDNAYGLSKLFAEEIVKKYYEWYGIRSLIYRISNVYGPGCRPYYNSVISSFIDMIQKGNKISVNGTGEQSRDFIFISDVVDAFLKAINNESTGAEIVNICTGTPISVNELIISLKKSIGTLPIVEYNESSEPINYLIGDPLKAANTIGFKAAFNLMDGLYKTINS